MSLEYELFLAVEDIYYVRSNVGALAYLDGDKVPFGNVVLHDYLTLGLVIEVPGVDLFDAAYFDPAYFATI